MSEEKGPVLPRYRSHKVVEAMQIRAIEADETSSDTLLHGFNGLGPVRVDAAYMKKHNPQPMGYYVRYPDGYESWSPKEAFEGGYEPVDSSE
mgnify:CR=1 FL=1